jgi:flagellar biosynthesis/type III secretory pathway protein FliH
VTRVLKADRVVGVKEEAHARVAAELAEEQERQAAIAAAYSAGYDDGRAAAAREGLDAPPRAAAALERLVALAEVEQRETADTTSRAVLAAAIDIAEWVLKHELHHSSKSLVERLQASALALLPSSTSRVHISPHDELAVRGWAVSHDIELVVDPGLDAGDARYESGAGRVDATVAAALRIAAEALGVDPSRGRI